MAELKTMGLTVPRVTLVALRLRELGVPIPATFTPWSISGRPGRAEGGGLPCLRM